MGMYGYVWVCMVIYGYVWVCMGMYGYVWVYMGIHLLLNTDTKSIEGNLLQKLVQVVKKAKKQLHVRVEFDKFYGNGKSQKMPSRLNF